MLVVKTCMLNVSHKNQWFGVWRPKRSMAILECKPWFSIQRFSFIGCDPEGSAAAVSEPALYRLLTFQVWNLNAPLSMLRSYQSISPGSRLCPWIFRNKIQFYSEELLAPRATPRLEDHPLSAVHECLFNIFAATLDIGGRSYICNQRTCHTVVTATHLSWHIQKLLLQNTFQYYRSINGYDFQKVSSLQDCNPNF